MLRFGYADRNLTLEAEGWAFSGTPPIAEIRARENVRAGSGITYLRALFAQNLEVLAQIIEWNLGKGLTMFRMPADLAPHLTSTEFLPKDARMATRALVYEFGPALLARMRKIGARAKQLGQRLTFHPDLRVTLNSPSAYIRAKSARDLYGLARIMDAMGLGLDSILVLHGGGIYSDKETAAARWVEGAAALPAAVRRRIVLENDEDRYGIDDVVSMAAQVGIPVLLDIFHYKCYVKRGPDKQSSLARILPVVIASWGRRRPKMHISEQRAGAIFGAHSDYVRSIPPVILRAAKTAEIDLMVEARKHEKAALALMKNI